MSNTTRFLATLPLFCGLTACLAPPMPEGEPTAASAELRIRPIGGLDGIDLQPLDPARVCPDSPAPRTVQIREANPQANKALHDQMRQLLMDSLKQANTTVLLGPNVVLDFSDLDESLFPLTFGPCVTLTSGSYALPPVVTTGVEPGGVLARAGAGPVIAARTIPLPLSNTPSRRPGSPGPLLTFGPHRSTDKVFLEVACRPGESPTSDNVTISGFRLIGPSYDQQDTEDKGINIARCLNVEVSNMEIAGWGGQGVFIQDDTDNDPRGGGAGQEQPSNQPGDRNGRPDQVRVFHNYIHHNQHPRTLTDGHTAGYGVSVHDGAWAQIYENVFDFNRHAIEAAGTSGGYNAERNLVLKGGGVHYDGLITVHTHQFDIHGTESRGKGGEASNRTLYADNSFQYREDNAIFVRGRPETNVTIRDNIFPHEGLEADWGDDAVNLYYHDDVASGRVTLGPNNTIAYDSYGKYGACDFDGDGVDDVFLATGRSWWFSSYGEFQWSYLAARHERIDQVRLGYFDDDNKCDVLTESDGQWVISSGGTGPWTSIGAYGAPISEVAFGRFNPSVRDHRAGVTKKTTDAFWRTSSGQWMVSPLTGPAWRAVNSSSFPMSQLRFGDFTGDGVTDVLAVENGHWSISESATGGWRTLNSRLSDPVAGLYMADLNNNNVDDLIKIEVTATPVGTNLNEISETVTWWVSDDGTSAWRKLKSYTFTRPLSALPLAALAGRFGAAPGGGVLLVGHDRIGRFYSEAETAHGASPEWNSLYAY